jgi:lysyl-tRNA synthetase class 1
MKESFFWADQKAREILDRKTYHFLDEAMPPRNVRVVKTSASLSGVLHIGRLSDTIRADSIVTALRDAGTKARMIWVAEDMDPLRKIPEGVPKEYEKYLGMPVTDVPDPGGEYASYADRHRAEYLDVMERFVANEVTTYSTREEYRKGSFRKYAKRLLDKRDEVRAILEKYRDSSLSGSWSPWKPICGECGKVITPRVTEADGTWIRYECQDYEFEKTLAKGCGHHGEADATRDDGKLLWKGEWASEWALWKVSCEGGGKEYEVPTSAWWVNGEIVEKVLDFPMPTPFFYEHLLIDGKKMSASLGNVVYPADWLKVAPPELLRFLYNKKLMKTRSFSWKELPRLYADYDEHAAVYYGDAVTSNAEEKEHTTRLFEISQLGPTPNTRPASLDFSFASLIAQVYDPETRLGEAREALDRSQVMAGQVATDEEVGRRLTFGLNWVRMFVPESALAIATDPDPELAAALTPDETEALRELAAAMDSDPDPDAIQSAVFRVARDKGMKPGRLFRILYRLIVGRDSGPRFGSLVAALGTGRVRDLLRSAASSN